MRRVRAFMLSGVRRRTAPTIDDLSAAGPGTKWPHMIARSQGRGGSVPAREKVLASSMLLALASATLFAPQASAGRPRCLGKRATIVGTNGSERIRGTNDDDVIVARGGGDYVLARRGRDFVCAGLGDDHVLAGRGGGGLKGAGGEDTLVGGTSTELLSGGRGADTLFPSGGIGGQISGGRGRDWLAFTDRRCGRGIKVDFTEHTVEYPGCDRGSRTGAWTVFGVAHVDGSDAGDVIVGGEGHNIFVGQEGRDVLKGRADGDLLVGGPGHDNGWGGTGHDVCRSIESRHSC
jgi:Ca2+-binding RTX toxin-like protein